MKKILCLALALVLCVCMFAGCNKSSTSDPETDLDAIKAKGKIVIGITDYAPMDYKDENNEWTGFDAEFARLFAEELGVEVEFIEINWDTKFLELKNGSIDCIWNGMTITDEVKANTSCSNAYVRNAQVVVMSADKVDDYESFEDMKDLTFAVEKGSAGEQALADLECNADNVVAVKDQATALLEVNAGTVDACVIDLTMANALAGKGNYSSLAKSIELTSEEYGVGFRTDSNLTEKFNEFLKKVKEDGTLQALAEKYELTLAD